MRPLAQGERRRETNDLQPGRLAQHPAAHPRRADRARRQRPREHGRAAAARRNDAGSRDHGRSAAITVGGIYQCLSERFRILKPIGQ